MNNKFYIWGGQKNEGQERRSNQKCNVEVFDPALETWSTIEAPSQSKRYGGASASKERCFYVYGGHKPHHNLLDQYDTSTKSWKRLPNGPSKKTGCRMVCYEDYLILFGSSADGQTNELSRFNLKSGELMLH